MVRPANVAPGGWSEWLEDPIKALGNLVRAGIIGYLRQNGPATRAEIAAALDLPVPTVAQSLKAMVQSGLLTTAPAPRGGAGVGNVCGTSSTRRRSVACTCNSVRL